VSRWSWSSGAVARGRWVVSSPLVLGVSSHPFFVVRFVCCSSFVVRRFSFFWPFTNKIAVKALQMNRDDLQLSE
jgi:hypothetical protein